jgi:hypothetical protein
MKAEFEKIFNGSGKTFSAKNEAEKWLAANGYSYGCSCAMAPQAIVKGDVVVAKWRNLTAKERNQVDGLLYAGREGSARLVLRREPHLILAEEMADSTMKESLRLLENKLLPEDGIAIYVLKKQVMEIFGDYLDDFKININRLNKASKSFYDYIKYDYFEVRCLYESASVGRLYGFVVRVEKAIVCHDPDKPPMEFIFCSGVWRDLSAEYVFSSMWLQALGHDREDNAKKCELFGDLEEGDEMAKVSTKEEKLKGELKNLTNFTPGDFIAVDIVDLGSRALARIEELEKEKEGLIEEVEEMSFRLSATH